MYFSTTRKANDLDSGEPDCGDSASINSWRLTKSSRSVVRLAKPKRPIEAATILTEMGSCSWLVFKEEAKLSTTGIAEELTASLIIRSASGSHLATGMPKA